MGPVNNQVLTGNILTFSVPDVLLKTGHIGLPFPQPF